MRDYYQINYFFVLGEHGGYSPFAGFGMNVLWIGELLQELARFPASILELPWDIVERSKARVNSPVSYSIIPLENVAFQDIGGGTGFFNIVFTDPSLPLPASANFSRWEEAPLCLDSTAEVPVLIKEVHDYLTDIAKKRVVDRTLELPSGFLKKLLSRTELPPTIIPQAVARHFSIDIMLKALESANHKFLTESPMPPSQDPSRYYEQIVKVAEWLVKVRDTLRFKNHKSRIWDVDLVLCSQSLLDRQTIQEFFRDLPAELRNAAKAFEVQKDFMVGLNLESTTIESIQLLGQIRRQEQQVQTGIMTLLASLYFCPVLRLPASLQTDIRKEIVGLLTSSPPKRGRMFTGFLKKLQSLFPTQYAPLFNHSRQMRIKIYSDSPSEFIVLPGRRLPLFLEHQVCRLPVTPGNVFLSTATRNDVSIYSFDQICRVLILRSFNDSDPIKYHLEEACRLIFDSFADPSIASLGRHTKRVNYEIVDVASVEEMKAVLETRDPGILIFDCHGSHGTSDTSGHLSIGIDKFNIESIDFPIKLPEIIVLCACETYPLFPGYRSVANGFLLRGVKSIIGTNAKIGGTLGAEFVARLLYRVNDYFPMVLGHRRDAPVTWLEFTSGMQQMAYATDVLRCFLETSSLNERDYHTIHVAASVDINGGVSGWYNTMCESIGSKVGTTADEVNILVQNKVNFSNAMHYISIGNPERIFVENVADK